jgi:hypothetical protein
MDLPLYAYSRHFDGQVKAIHTSAGIIPSSVLIESGELDADDDSRVQWVNALWDSGATNSCISKNLAERLELGALGVVKMATASQIVETPVYLAHLVLPNHFALTDIKLLEFSEVSSGCDIIIGMDIINRGDFSITNLGGKTLFSFRMPSLHALDYEAEWRRVLSNG